MALSAILYWVYADLCPREQELSRGVTAVLTQINTDLGPDATTVNFRKLHRIGACRMPLCKLFSSNSPSRIDRVFRNRSRGHEAAEFRGSIVLHSLAFQSPTAVRTGVFRRVRQTAAQFVASQLCALPEPSSVERCVLADSGVAQRSVDGADPLASVGIAITQGDFCTADRLLQLHVRRLSDSVPPKPLRIRDWLVLTCLAILREDPASAGEFLQQGERQHTGSHGSHGQHSLDTLYFSKLLLTSLVKSSAGPTGEASEVLDQAELQATGPAAALRMWLVLQLRAAIALQEAQYRFAWQVWQAALLLQRQTGVSFHVQPQVSADRDWVADMASREAAVANN